MSFEPGEVVILKSGGQPMTVTEVDDNGILCLWLGEEGELFRETLPAVTLELATVETEEDEDEHENGDEEEDDEGEEDDEEDDEEDSRAVA